MKNGKFILAIVSEIIKLHNGKVEFESELDKGSLFTLNLPLGSK